MNITFLKSLIISFGFHALVISLFLMEGKEFKKSETSMTEIIFLSSTETNNIEKKKTNIQEAIKKTKDVKDKTNVQNNLVSSVEKKRNEHESYKVSQENLTSNNIEKKNFDNSFLENKFFNSPDNTKKPFNYKIQNFSENQNTKSTFESSATYKIGSEKNPYPTYPLIARKKGWQGRLLLNVRVSKKGKVLNINIVKTSGFKILDKTSVETIKDWEFTPARIGKNYVEDYLNIPISFKLIN